MKIVNRRKDALESNMTTEDLGKAMAQLDLSNVPDHRKSEAVMDHLMKIMADAIYDKDKAQEIHISRILRRRQNG
ncbi:MAG: hypothetical protein EBV86_07305 [Marivivens sp.]|nr:hypothetical protein [Marivivens sp.]NBT50392.1 hypothetical protein [Marivivens sp.]NCW68365.1 hypothetical protein [Marivivens sp.]